MKNLSGWVRACYCWCRLWLMVYRVRFRRLKNRLLYGRRAVARMDARVDQVMQPRRDEFRAYLRELDERYARAVREGRVEPLPHKLEDYEWPIS